MDAPAETERAAEVVCFGVIAPATLLIVEDLPPWNTGATVSRGRRVHLGRRGYRRHAAEALGSAQRSHRHHPGR